MKNIEKNVFVSFFKKHWIVTLVIAILLLSTLFVRGRSVQVRCAVGAEVTEYVRIDYSIYGYCIDVVPMEESSVEDARALRKELLFMGMDSSCLRVVEQWNEEYKSADFNFKVKGYVYNTNDRRDALIRLMRSKGYSADVIL